MLADVTVQGSVLTVKGSSAAVQVASTDFYVSPDGALTTRTTPSTGGVTSSSGRRSLLSDPVPYQFAALTTSDANVVQTASFAAPNKVSEYGPACYRCDWLQVSAAAHLLPAPLPLVCFPKPAAVFPHPQACP